MTLGWPLPPTHPFLSPLSGSAPPAGVSAVRDPPFRGPRCVCGASPGSGVRGALPGAGGAGCAEAPRGLLWGGPAFVGPGLAGGGGAGRSLPPLPRFPSRGAAGPSARGAVAPAVAGPGPRNPPGGPAQPCPRFLLLRGPPGSVRGVAGQDGAGCATLSPVLDQEELGGASWLLPPEVRGCSMHVPLLSIHGAGVVTGLAGAGASAALVVGVDTFFFSFETSPRGAYCSRMSSRCVLNVLVI